jgi:DNA-binding response OmpR family regulator
MKHDLLAGMAVLVVEDEYLIAIEAQGILEEAGAGTVLLANSVAEVTKLLADGPQIDAVILDLKLGREDASPLIVAFRDRGIPFVVATGFDAGTPEGVSRLSKPYRATELVEAILALLRK